MTDIVSPAWVAERLEDVALVDVRDAWEYDGIGHLPGAVNVPFDAYRADQHASEGSAGAETESGTEEEQTGGETANDGAGAVGMLPDPDEFAALLGEAGIDETDDVVAYDDMHGVFAARLLVTMELFGHDPGKLHLLDGDFSAWQREREVTDEAPGVDPVEYRIERPAETPLVDADAVAAAADDPDAVVLDTREAWEYEEGHVPGAVRLDWQALVDPETRGVLAPAEAEAVLAERGVTPDRRVVLYCNTARRISHTYVVLRHLGFEDVAFYEGSLTEWRAAGRPLATGDGETTE